MSNADARIEELRLQLTIVQTENDRLQQEIATAKAELASERNGREDDRKATEPLRRELRDATKVIKNIDPRLTAAQIKAMEGAAAVQTDLLTALYEYATKVSNVREGLSAELKRANADLKRKGDEGQRSLHEKDRTIEEQKR